MRCIPDAVKSFKLLPSPSKYLMISLCHKISGSFLKPFCILLWFHIIASHSPTFYILSSYGIRVTVSNRTMSIHIPWLFSFSPYKYKSIFTLLNQVQYRIWASTFDREATPSDTFENISITDHLLFMNTISIPSNLSASLYPNFRL